MFGYALRHPKLPASNGIINKAGLTPLTLACQLGKRFKWKTEQFKIRSFSQVVLKFSEKCWNCRQKSFGGTVISHVLLIH